MKPIQDNRQGNGQLPTLAEFREMLRKQTAEADAHQRVLWEQQKRLLEYSEAVYKGEQWPANE